MKYITDDIRLRLGTSEDGINKHRLAVTMMDVPPEAGDFDLVCIPKKVLLKYLEEAFLLGIQRAHLTDK